MKQYLNVLQAQALKMVKKLHINWLVTCIRKDVSSPLLPLPYPPPTRLRRKPKPPELKLLARIYLLKLLNWLVSPLTLRLLVSV